MLIINGGQLLELLNQNRNFTAYTKALLESHVESCRLDVVEFEAEIESVGPDQRDYRLMIPLPHQLKGQGLNKVRVFVIKKEETDGKGH